MGKGSKAPSWTIPTYTDPTYKTFSNNTGSTSYNNGQFSYTPNQANQDFQTQLDATRSAILKHMGGSDQATTDSLNNWEQTYNNEANRLSAPALSNGLFDRGLGGSQYYMGSLNDLLSKNANNAILNKYQLQNQDFNQNQTSFTNVNNAENGLTNDANTLLSDQANYANNQDARNLDLYKTTLPYKATYDAGKQSQGFGGLIGGVIGGVGGAIVGGPAGAVMGAQFGSSIGGGVDASQGNGSVGSQIYEPALQALSFSTLPSQLSTQSAAFGGVTAPYSAPSSNFINNPGLNFSYLR